MQKAFRIIESNDGRGFYLEGIGFKEVIAPAGGLFESELAAYRAARELGHITPDID
jgi:hypothetical protein